MLADYTTPQTSDAATISQKLRTTERPPNDVLLREIAETNYCAVGRKYGVTDKAIRKWVRADEREAVEEASDGD